MINNEQQLVSFLKKDNNFNKCFNRKNNYKPEFNYPILGIITNKIIGSADLVFTKSRIKYIVEIKFDNFQKRGDFWQSLKVIGYAKNEQIKSPNIIVKPAIMIRKDIINVDIICLLGLLKISYFLFSVNEKGIEWEINL